jgi:DNA-binding MarR family transcriptional regulator
VTEAELRRRSAMATRPTTPSALRIALQRYIDARHAALIEARRTLGVNELDARAILYIATHPQTRPSHLREYLGITAAGVTTLVDRLVQREVVQREVDPDDRRVNRLSLTVDLAVTPWAALAASDCAESDRFAQALTNLTTLASGVSET